MTEMQAKQNNGAIQQSQYDFNATQSHLEALNHRLVELLGDDYAIQFDEPAEFDLEGEPFIRYPNRCVYFSHNDKHYDKKPSGWIAVSQKDGHLISDCWVCDRPQIIKRHDGYQPAPTLRTLSRNDKRLLKTLLDFGCEEVEEVNDLEQPAVAFPVTYADGSQGYHYRVALEGKEKWLHIKGGKASQAVFGLYDPKIQAGIREAGYVVIVESPPDAATLITAGFPAIAVLGKGNAKALACDQHRQTLLDLVGENGVIYVWVEPDAKDFAQEVANALQRPVKVIYPPDYAKDALRIWLAHGKDWEALRSIVNDLIGSATEIAPQPKQATEPKVDRHDTTAKFKVAIPERAFKRLGDIKVQDVDWLVRDYLPIAAVTLLAGEGSAGKSTLLCDLAASIVKGEKWLNEFAVEQGGVILIVTEGILEIRSRLEGYGITDNDPLIIFDLTEWDDYTPLKAAQALPEILQLAKERLGNIPVKLVGLDCLRGFGFDEKQASRQKGDRLPTVREIYNPIANFAQHEGAAVIVTHHFRKLLPEERRRLYPKRKKGKDVAPEIDVNLLRNLIAGTADIVNAARHALVVVSNLEAGTTIIVPVKSNRSQSLGSPIQYDWKAETPTFMGYLDEEEKEIERACNFLRRVLGNGALPSEEVKALAIKEGIKDRTYWRARSRLGVKAKKVFVDGKLIWITYLPSQTNQANQPDHQPNPLPDGDPQGSPPDYPAGNGCLPTNLVDNPNFGSLGSVGEKTKQNLEFCSLPTKKAFGSVGSVGREPASVEDCQDCQTQNHWQTTLADYKSPINTGIFVEDCQDCQTSGNVEAQPEGDPQGNPTDLFADFFDMGILPDLIVGDSPTEPEESPTLPCAQAQSEGSPPDEPEEIPPAQPFATLTEAICPNCGERLDPDRDSGLVACVGCGRLFKVEDNPDDDNNPPDGSPNGGQGGLDQSPIIPPAQPETQIYPNKFQSTESPKRMTVRLPDGSIKLEWDRKTETVAPDDLKGWQPIETIPEISLPNIESVEIPPVVVLDLETDGLDPAKGSISAAGLALYLNGKEVETLIIANKGNEADLLAQTFDYLRETCNKLGNVILTGYNMFDFDLTYLIERARKLKVECPFRYLKDRETGEIKRWKVAATEGTLRGDPLDYPAIATDLPIKVIDTLHLVCRWDYTAKALRNYDLKSVAAYFNVNQPDRPILSPDQILNSFQHDRKTFEAYLMADLRETYALFETHIKPYAGVAALTKLPLDQVATRSTAWVWQQILERHYKEIPQPDEKRKYEGGLVVSRKGLWFPCLKVDIASLYPTIMLAYRIHSRKDTDQIALRWLKTLTRQRLELKAKAKAGDANAQILQEAMKILLNSLYGFYGTGGYGFNDMGAAAKVTEVGRKVLTLMIEAVEDAGGLVVEADTDGLIICHANADLQQILNAITAAIPPVFKVEVEWQEAVCFVSDDKSYIVLPKEGDPIIKGSKWRGRDKEAYLTKAIPTFVRLWALEGKDAALAFALQTLNEIRTGQGWRWVIRSHRVSKADKFLLQAGFKVGEIATYAYKDKKRGIVAREPEDGYDCDYYAKQFSKTLKEVVETIDPAQTNEAGEMVGTEAPSLIFGSVIAAEVS
jgi:hypothetical protein